MKKQLLLIILTFSLSAHCQLANEKIVLGNVETIYSSILKENRTIWVHMPDTTNKIYQQKKYPVVFLLDGEEFFYSTVGTIQFLSHGKDICPDMIVVGILHPDRMHDLTPWQDHMVPKDSNMVRTSGGGEVFTSFMEKELIPYIESHYPAAPFRALAGHSLGGLLVLNTLLNHTNLFSAYIAMDPSIFWADQQLLKRLRETVKNKNFENKSLFMGISGTNPSNVDSLMKDKTLNTIYTRSILEFDDLIRTSNLRYDEKYYTDETHNSVALLSVYDALHFLFVDNRQPAYNRDTVTTIFFVNHYQHVSEKMGYRVSPPEDLVNGLGYNFLQKKLYDRSYEFFQLNINNYPESFNVYDSMSDLYIAENKKEKAIECLKKELALKEIPYAREKLGKLEKNK